MTPGQRRWRGERTNGSSIRPSGFASAPAGSQSALCLWACSCLLLLSACNEETEVAAASCREVSGTVEISAGTYPVGSNQAYPEEGPTQDIEVQTFWISKTEVTVAQFQQFIEATGYQTVAERDVDPAVFGDVELTAEQELQFLSPGGAVFSPPQNPSMRQVDWWVYTPGAHWRYPQGPQAPAANPSHPVTQIALADALAYADWAGARLPSEAEWEVAASFGSSSDNPQTTAPENANTWQGVFPIINQETDGYLGVAPVACYAPNKAGLYDMIGNVWEWTADRYHDQRLPTDSVEPSRPKSTGDLATHGTIKGGSYLCAPNYCMRYRPSARQAQETGLGTNHIGFRLAYDQDPQAN